MSRHILIVSGLRPDYKYKTHGAFIQQQAETLSRHGYKIGMLYIGMRSVFTLFEGNILEYSSGKIIEKENQYFNELQIKAWFFGGFPSLREQHYSRLSTKLFNRYVKMYGQPDLIHAHFAIWPGVIASNLLRKYKIPYVLTEHSTAYSRNIIKSKYKYLIKKALDNAKCVICVSEGLKNSVKSYSVNENFEVVGNIVKTDLFIQKEGDIKNDDYRIFSLGYLTKKKGFDLILKAFGSLINNNQINSNIKLAIGGNGPEMDELIKITNSYNIQDRVEFLGELNQDEVILQLQNSDLFALPSRHETFGIVFIEAMSCGKPVIATKTEGPVEFITKDVGYIINIDDQEALQSAIIDAIQRRAFWKENSITIRNYVINNFSEEVFIKKTEEIYSKYF